MNSVTANGHQFGRKESGKSGESENAGVTEQKTEGVGFVFVWNSIKRLLGFGGVSGGKGND